MEEDTTENPVSEVEEKKEAEVAPADDFAAEIEEVLEQAPAVKVEAKDQPYKYEITFIVGEDQNATDVVTVLEANGAKINSTEEIGVKKLAYPIKKLQTGKYITVYFEVAPRDLIKIERTLKLKKSVIRYLIVKAIRKPIKKQGEGMPVNVEAKAEAKVIPEIKEAVVEKIEISETPEVKEEEVKPVKAVKTAPKKAESKPVKPAKTAKPKPEKISKSELDKKLEQLVED